MLFITILFFSCIFGYDWSHVDAVLQNEMGLHTFPGFLLLSSHLTNHSLGAVAAVISKKGIIYQKAIGNFTYGSVPPRNTNNPPMNFQSVLSYLLYLIDLFFLLIIY
jgi:hypothetical protein